MEDYEELDGLGLADRVKQGAVSAEALLEIAIQRTEEQNPSLGAVNIPMFEQAREAVAKGVPRGPFEGVPFLLKDLHLHTLDAPLTNGSALYRDFQPSEESELVRLYRASGLVVFGKSHSPEFGITTSSESALHGQTKNPWSSAHSAGGSSGGAAAAVAAGILPLANASDGGGSIRIPASCCGLFGIKPTRGRTPMGPVTGEGWSGMSCVHAVTRSVRDSAALLDATSGPDLGAPYAAQPPVRPFLEEVAHSPGRLRIALQRETWNFSEPHADCLTALDEAARICRDLGHEVEEAPFVVDRGAFGQATGTIISSNTRADMEHRAEQLGRPLREDDVEPRTWGLSSLAAGFSATDYVSALATIHETGRGLARHLQKYDVLLSPTMATPPLPLGVLSLSNPDAEEQITSVFSTVGYTQMMNATGNPAMSVPLSWNAEGLPIGVQFAGRMGDEATLFQLAGQLEKAHPWFGRLPSRS